MHNEETTISLVCLQGSTQRSGMRIGHSRPTYSTKYVCAVCVLRKVWLLAMAGGLHLSEGEGHAAGCSRQHGALHLICLAVGNVVLPAVACRAGHHQQGPRWQKDGMAFSCLPELHHCGASQRQGSNGPCMNAAYHCLCRRMHHLLTVERPHLNCDTSKTKVNWTSCYC